MKDRELVTKTDEGYCIGPLTEEEYLTINDALELAAAWVDRETDKRVAKALYDLIPHDVDDIESAEEEECNPPGALFDKLPEPCDVKDTE